MLHRTDLVVRTSLDIRGHTRDAAQCHAWPVERYTPCGIDWQGRHWHNIGWVHQEDSKDEVRYWAATHQVDVCFGERPHPTWVGDWSEAFLSEQAPM